MAIQTQDNFIYVPALMDGLTEIVPQFWLGKDVEYRQDRKSNSLSAAEYLAEFRSAGSLKPSVSKDNSQMQLCTLAELRHAFTANDDYKQSVLSKRGYGEWTSTFLQDGKRAVERPENVVYRNGVWVLEGGKVTPVELPPNGWTLEYDKPTGFPSRTSEERKDAEKVFGDDTSYFCRTMSGTRAVLRHFNLHDDGPFYVNANYKSDDRNSNIGGRACHYSEPGK